MPPSQRKGNPCPAPPVRDDGRGVGSRRPRSAGTGRGSAGNPSVLAPVAASWTAYVTALGAPADPSATSFGEKVAEYIFALRASDRDAGVVDTVTSATWSESPGELQYGRDPLNPKPAHGPHYGKNALFAAHERYALLSPGTLPLPVRAAAYHDTRVHGAALELPNSRAPEQTTIGIFWAYDGVKLLGTPPRLYNRIVHQFAAAHALSMEENLVLLAQVNAAMGDAAVLAWQQKYEHNYWRPVTAIRELGSSLGTEALTSCQVGRPRGPRAENSCGSSSHSMESSPRVSPRVRPSARAGSVRLTLGFEHGITPRRGSATGGGGVRATLQRCP